MEIGDMCYWQASTVSETLPGVINGDRRDIFYIFIYVTHFRKIRLNTEQKNRVFIPLGRVKPLLCSVKRLRVKTVNVRRS